MLYRDRRRVAHLDQDGDSVAFLASRGLESSHLATADDSRSATPLADLPTIDVTTVPASRLCQAINLRERQRRARP
jgi:hypothetical protein